MGRKRRWYSAKVALGSRSANRSGRNPVATGHIGFPVGAGNHHVLGISDDDLFGADLPEGRRNDVATDIMATGEFDILAEILCAERQAAILRVTTDPLDEHIGAFRLFGGEDVGTRSHGFA